MKTSEEIKQIIPALIKVQAQIKGMRPDASNPFFKNKYITLDGILEYIRPLLVDADILLIQNAHSEGEYSEVVTTLIHKSGEYIETDTLRLKPSKNDAQQIGSSITYAKRYQLSALLGISSEVDDDGNKATHGSSKPKDNTGSPRDFSNAQIKRFYTLASLAGISETKALETVQKKYGVLPMQMTKAQYNEVCKSLEAKKG